MKVFKIEIILEPKEGFKFPQLQKVIEKNLYEVNHKLVASDYQEKAKDLCPEIPKFNKKLDVAIFYVEVSNSFNFRVALGCCVNVHNDEYPHYNFYGINPGMGDLQIEKNI